MAIHPFFMIKHVRAYQETGYNTYCSEQMIKFLIDELGMSILQVTGLFGLWRATARNVPSP